MTLPTYKVEFTGQTPFILSEHAPGATWTFGTAARRKVRYKLNITDIGTYPFWKRVELYLDAVFNGATPPSNTFFAEIRLVSDDTLIATSQQSYDSSSWATPSTWQAILFTFLLDDYAIDFLLDENFYIVIDVDVTDANAWTIRSHSTNTIPETTLEYWNGSSWVLESATEELEGEIRGLRPKTFDITQYVRDFTIDTGKSDVDGDYVEGQAELTLKNKDGRFSPYLESSPYYPYWDVMARIIITANYSSTDYDMFYGFLTRIRPDLDISKRDVQVSASDRFGSFKEHKITVTVPADETPHEVVAAILSKLNIPSSQYDLDATDPTLLAGKTWDEVDGIDALGDVIESGQHHHFIGGDGKYIFKSNLWLGGDPAGDYVWNQEDVDGFKIEHDIKGVFNRFRTRGATGGWQELKDTGSIISYNQRDLEVDNDLIKDAGGAQEVNQMLFSRFTKRVRGADFDIKSVFPDVLDFRIGHLIDFTEPNSGLTNEKFVVFGMKKKVEPTGPMEVTLRTKKHYSPPYWFDVTTPNATVGVNANNLTAQSFKIPKSGGALRVKMKLTYSFPSFLHTLYCVLWDDNSGEPGTIIAITSAGVFGLGSGTIEIEKPWEFLYPAPFLEEDILYWIGIQMTGPGGTDTYQLWGTSPGDYADGQAAYWNGTIWVMQPTVDYWSSQKIFPDYNPSEGV